MRWMFMPLWRCFDFAGRSRRLEFVLFQLIYVAALLALVIWIYGIFHAIGAAGDSGHPIDDAAAALGPALAAFGLFLMFTTIPTIALQVRRFHDQDMSGWLVLLNLIPGAGGMIVFVLMLLPGTAGPNRFGPDPRR